MSITPVQRTVLITGASNTESLGYTVARQLALQHDFTVILGSRSSPSSETMQKAVKQLQSEGAKYGVHALHIDVGSDESIAKAVGEVEARFGRLDVSCLDIF